MKRLSLVASLFAFGGLSMLASGAQANPIDVPFSTDVAGNCIVAVGDVLPALPDGLTLPVPVVPGTLGVPGDSSETLSSATTAGGTSGLIGLICTQNFTASAGPADLRNASGISTFDEANSTTTAINVNGVSGSGGTIGINVLKVDMDVDTTDGSAVAAGDYYFTVPVTITGS